MNCLFSLLSDLKLVNTLLQYMKLVYEIHNAVFA